MIELVIYMINYAYISFISMRSDENCENYEKIMKTECI